MKQISRREFLELTGLFAGTLSLGILPSCTIKNEDAEKISLQELSKYHLITLEDNYNPVLLVKYNKQPNCLVISMLNTRQGILIEVEVARETAESKEEAIDNFHQNYHVISDDLALPYFDEHFGLKEDYTINEVNYVIEVNKISKDEKEYVKK